MDLSSEEQSRTVITLFDKFKDIALTGNEGNFDRLGEVIAGLR
jgi:hypothetical protein